MQWYLVKRRVKYRNFVFYRLYFFSLKFGGIVFVSSWYDSIISSHVSTESFIILAKYIPFSWLHVAGF